MLDLNEYDESTIFFLLVLVEYYGKVLNFFPNSTNVTKENIYGKVIS